MTGHGTCPHRGPDAPPGTALPFSAEVAQYLADCAAHPGLECRYHPTEDGAVKLIWHRGPDQAGQIRAAFRAAAEPPETAASRQPAPGDAEPAANPPEPGAAGAEAAAAGPEAEVLW